MENQQIDIEELPELETSVAAYGSTVQEEVGGAQCIAVLLINPPNG